MDYSEKKRRTMSDALRRGRVSDEALSFVRGQTPTSGDSQPSDSTLEPVSSTRNTGPVEDPCLEPPRAPNVVAPEPRPSLPHFTVVIPAIVSVSFRLPANLSARLVRISSERKLQRQRPFSQQDIVADALRRWFECHGYADSDRD